jgi:hypothetical protein
MSNGNRERKLLHHQKPIWRKAFEASMLHTSIEAAEKKAWVAVDIWERVGAFNESQPPRSDERSTVSEPDPMGYEEGWKTFARWLESLYEANDNQGDFFDAMRNTILDFLDGDLTVEEFQLRLASLL